MAIHTKMDEVIDHYTCDICDTRFELTTATDIEFRGWQVGNRKEKSFSFCTTCYEVAIWPFIRDKVTRLRAMRNKESRGK